MIEILILAQKVITTFYRRVIVLSRTLDDALPHAHPPFPIEITELDETTLHDYGRFRPAQDPSAIRQRIADGDRCFLVWAEGQIVHSGWVATQRKSEPYLRCTLVLEAGDIFLYDHFTRPSCRGKGLSQAREIHVLTCYRELGFQRSVAIVAVENKPAFRPFQALGYRPIGTLVCLWWIAGKTIRRKHWSREPLPEIARGRAANP
jgi:GNAT superfamily N-acetyltransferase